MYKGRSICMKIQRVVSYPKKTMLPCSVRCSAPLNGSSLLGPNGTDCRLRICCSLDHFHSTELESLQEGPVSFQKVNDASIVYLVFIFLFTVLPRKKPFNYKNCIAVRLLIPLLPILFFPTSRQTYSKIDIAVPSIYFISNNGSPDPPRKCNLAYCFMY